MSKTIKRLAILSATMGATFAPFVAVHAVDTPIDAAAVTSLGSSVLTVMQNAAQPVLVLVVVVVGALIGLYFSIRFIRRMIK